VPFPPLKQVQRDRAPALPGVVRSSEVMRHAALLLIYTSVNQKDKPKVYIYVKLLREGSGEDRAGSVSSASVAVMKDGVASHTARSVAARRLTLERRPAHYGDPAADLALSRDVAAGLEPAPGRMHDYIRARTAFFDRVVVTAVNDGVPQVVVGAAGYDARSLRYARPGVRWFEVDHPATQADKLERLRRLGIDARHVRFIAADFRVDAVAAALRDAGLDPREPALFWFEGIAVYLDKAVTESVLAQFREVTVPGSTLAISVSLTSAARGSTARARFTESVAAMGEPARSFLEPAEAAQLLARAGWQLDDRGQQPGRRTAAGLLTARAVPAHSIPLPSVGALRHASTPKCAEAKTANWFASGRGRAAARSRRRGEWPRG
jgi:methyltransferase (TIGR00027 family)